MRWLVMQRILGIFIMLVSVVFIPSICISLYMQDGITDIFTDTLAICWVTGFLIWLPVRHCQYELRRQDSLLITVFLWILTPALCTLPFIWGPVGLSLTAAYFEAVSGITTTGATMLNNLDQIPKSLLFYRQSLQFWGGLAFIIVAISVLPVLRIGGSQLFRAEVTNPIKTRLTPRVIEATKMLGAVFLGLNICCALAYWLAGMTLFDAIAHAFSTISTGGFSTYDANFAHFNSPLLEALAMIFMLLGGLNFALHFQVWQRASSQAYFKDVEARVFLALIILLSLGLAIALRAFDTYPDFLESLRYALFQLISCLTTTGFKSAEFSQWPGFIALMLVLVGFIGGCSGSAVGGMKVVRIILLFRQGFRELQQLVHPRGRFVFKLGEQSISGAVLAAVTGFCTFYVASFTVLTILLAATDVDLLTAFSAIATCINNMGPGLGAVAKNFFEINQLGVWICSFAMIMGRLEVFAVLVLFTPVFWKNQ